MNSTPTTRSMKPNDLYSNALDTIYNCYDSLTNDRNALLKLDNHSLLIAILSSVSKINGKIVDIFNAENEKAINEEEDTTDCCNNNNNNHSTDNTYCIIDDFNKNDDVNTRNCSQTANGLSSTLDDFVNNNNNNKSHNGSRSLCVFDESAKNSNDEKAINENTTHCCSNNNNNNNNNKSNAKTTNGCSQSLSTFDESANNNNAFTNMGNTFKQMRLTMLKATTKSTGKCSQNEKRAYDVGFNIASLKSRFSVPIIESLKWGEMVVSYNNKLLTFKDCILSPNKAENWDWSNDGTHHNPGITIKAVKNVIDDCDIIILTKGINEKLQTSPKTMKFMKRQKKKSFYILETRKAVEKYHQLIDENYKSVGGLFHSTC